MAVTRAGFITFIRDVMGIGQAYLPDSSLSITYALEIAQAIVLPQLSQISPTIFEQATYNLAGDNLINYAQDVSAAITTITWLSGVATVTTAAAHGFQGGDPIVIAGESPPGYNSAPASSFTISVTGATTFTYPLSTDPGAQTDAGTASQIYFATLRKQFNSYGFVAGIISASGDESTNQTLTVPDKMKNLTMANLQQLKTPYGRQYMAFVESFGPIWGLTT